MSNPFTQARQRAHPLVVAAALLTSIVPFYCGATAAAAADMSMGNMPMNNMSMKAAAAPVYQWSGCYVGLNAGGGAGASSYTATVGPGTHLLTTDPALVGADGTGSMNASNFLGGGQAGCNWQSGTLVYGLEGDFDYFHSKSQFINPFDTLSDGVTPFTLTQTLTNDFLATVRPRIGIAADRNLGYLTGGVAFTKTSYTETYADGAAPAGAGTATGSKFLTGWTVGAGWEYAWTDHWTFKAEYLFAMFGKSNASGVITDATPASNPFSGTADLMMQIVRLGVNYKF
jgi:outer membrane immunogenic protein